MVGGGGVKMQNENTGAVHYTSTETSLDNDTVPPASPPPVSES